MRTINSLLSLTVVTFFTTLFPYSEARAFANGDGICSPAEQAQFNCANLGPGNVIEFVGQSNATCFLANFISGTPCSVYWYRYTGSTTNQVLAGIPDGVQTKYTSADASSAGCSQLITDGSGDPTTGFLNNDATQNVCRIANNLSGAPTNPDPVAPATANFFMTADPSFPAKRPWQIRQSKTQVYAGEINGPFSVQATIASSGETITGADGTTLTYRLVGGVPQIISCKRPDGSNCLFATVLDLGQTALCFESTSGTTTIGGKSFNCEVVTFVDGNPNFKAGANSTCYKYVGGRPIAYDC